MGALPLLFLNLFWNSFNTSKRFTHILAGSLKA